jgi:hypothetical protein
MPIAEGSAATSFSPPSQPTPTPAPGGVSTSCDCPIRRSTRLSSHSIFGGSGAYMPNTHITWPSFDTFHRPGPGRLPETRTWAAGACSATCSATCAASGSAGTDGGSVCASAAALSKPRDKTHATRAATIEDPFIVVLPKIT